MNQLSLFETDEQMVRIYEALDECGYAFEVERYKIKAVYYRYGISCFVKTRCGKLLDMFVATSAAAYHQVFMVYDNLSVAVIEKHLAKVKVEYR